MHTIEERKEAIKIYNKFKSYSRIVRKLGYPNIRTLIRWVKEYNKNGFLHKEFKKNNNSFYKNKHTEEQINTAVNHYLEFYHLPLEN